MTVGAHASIQLDGETLRFTGALERAQVAALWARQPSTLQGVRCFDLTAVDRIDSAGLAFLSCLATQCDTLAILSAPEGFTALRAAYRLDDRLGFTPSR